MDETTAREARLLLRAFRAGSLATAGADGQPFASLVTHAVAPDGDLLMLLSDLSEHTRQLRAASACALMVSGSPTGPNPQTAPRVSVLGQAAIDDDPASRARWLAVHPYAAFYAGFGDFNLWRLRPTGAHYVGGFARAFRFGASDLRPPEPARLAVAAAEPGIVAHCNADHPDALDAIAADGAGWTMVACDTEGFDLARGDQVRHVAFPAPADGPGAVRAALVHLARAARNAAITTAGPPPPRPL